MRNVSLKTLLNFDLSNTEMTVKCDTTASMKLLNCDCNGLFRTHTGWLDSGRVIFWKLQFPTISIIERTGSICIDGL